MKTAALLIMVFLIACSAQMQEGIHVTVEGNPIAGEPSIMTVAIKENGEPANLEILHERLFHVIAIHETFTEMFRFSAENPSGENIKDASFIMEPTFPTGGKYLLRVDFSIAGEQHSHEEMIEVKGDEPEQRAFLRQNLQQFGDYTVNLVLREQTFTADRDTHPVFYISTAAGPTEDLEPHLGAAMHLTIVKDDLSILLLEEGAATNIDPMNHRPGRIPTAFGPSVMGHITFPEQGTYHLFGEFKHGKVQQIHYVLDVH